MTQDAAAVDVADAPPFAFAAAPTLEEIRQLATAQLALDSQRSALQPSARDQLFALLEALGGLGGIGVAATVSTYGADWSAADRAVLSESLAAVLVPLVLLADECRVDLPTAAHEKMLKNARKYPPTVALAPLSVVPAAVPSPATSSSRAFQFETASTLELFRLKTVHFADERNWPRNLTPRNLLLALSVEVGELCEIFQWKGDDTAPLEWSPAERTHLGEELSDVLLYLVQLADRSFSDLATAVRAKLAKDAASQ